MKYILVTALAVLTSATVNAVGNAGAGQGKAAVCAACHGVDGIGTCLLYTSPSPRDRG